MIRKTLPLAALPLLAACATTPAANPQDAFWEALTSHCGNAYAGQLVSEDARDADWEGRAMVAHWAECNEGHIAIAFHVESPDDIGGWNRSRTWMLSRVDIETDAGESVAEFISLHHDHRHYDGLSDLITYYGGATEGLGTARGQDFPVDSDSIALFEREGLTASVTNVWRMEVDPAGTPGGTFVYQLTRENDPTRLFRVRFDASEPVAAPPPAWGW